MKAHYIRLMDVLHRFCMVVAGFCLVAITLMIPYGVFTRYVLNSASSWPEPMAVLLMIWWGSRTSLLIGFLAALLSMVIGTVLGIAAGHFRGWIGAVILRVTDWFLVLPSLVTALVLAAILGGPTATIIVAIGVTSWPSTARLIRAQTLAVEARPYIERSLALGAGHWHIATRHVLPNLRALNFVVEGLLGEGVASSTRFDPQAKAVGEWLRARHVDVPVALLDPA